MRGCDPSCSCSRPADRCTDSSDCAKNLACLRGYCVDPGVALADEDCRKSTACHEQGACTAVRKSSFLGADPGLECAADNDQDCRQSVRCKTRGLCARSTGDVGCSAADVDMCRASERCKSNEECLLGEGECVRRWTGCPALVVADTPLWAAPVDLVWDYDSLRTPSQPGDLKHATIACRIEGHDSPASIIRIAGQCAPGPHVSDGTAKLLRADVTLHTGDAIAAAMQDGPTGSARSSFAQLRYDGASPALGGTPGESIECVVVPRALALERSRRELAAVDAGLAAAKREKPDPQEPRDVPAGIESARVHAERAALWLGWRDPELAGRVKKLDAAAAAWQVHKDK
jgi:hypothetical protein